MKLPRDLSGEEMARLLRRHFGYQITRTKGSHMILTANVRGNKHNVTTPRHRQVRIGSLDGILTDVATANRLPKEKVRKTLFG